MRDEQPRQKRRQRDLQLCQFCKQKKIDGELWLHAMHLTGNANTVC